MFKENPIYQNCIEGCRKGDRAAQRKMFEALAPKMLAVCFRYMGERAAAEDASGWIRDNVFQDRHIFR